MTLTVCQSGWYRRRKLNFPTSFVKDRRNVSRIFLIVWPITALAPMPMLERSLWERVQPVYWILEIQPQLCLQTYLKKVYSINATVTSSRDFVCLNKHAKIECRRTCILTICKGTICHFDLIHLILSRKQLFSTKRQSAISSPLVSRRLPRSKFTNESIRGGSIFHT